MFALKRRLPRDERENAELPDDTPQLPLASGQSQDMDAAIDDVMARFPSTLDHLAR